VLVEEAPGGGRRRILRPWGLRRSAPPTVSPDLPDLRSETVGSAPAAGAGWRLDLWFAGAVVAAVSVVAALYPGLQASESRTPPRNGETVLAAPAVVSLPMTPVAAETRLSSPALVEPARPMAAPPSKPEPPARSRERSREPVPVAAPPDPVPEPPPAPIVVAAAPPPPVAVARPAPDRWQALRDQLGGCVALGLFERAMCEQRARLQHCDGYWGHVGLCPAGRTEFGQ
jgi:hypothetical protein